MNNLRMLTRAVFVLLFALGLIGPVAASAQDATPGPGGPLTASIHQGTCANLGSGAYDVGQFRTAQEKEPDAEVRGVAPASPIMVLDSEVDGTDYETLLDKGPYALAIHQGDTVVACGDIGGVDDRDHLTVALLPVDGSRWARVALLDEDEATMEIGDDEVEVEIYLFTLAS